MGFVFVRWQSVFPYDSVEFGLCLSLNTRIQDHSHPERHRQRYALEPFVSLRGLTTKYQVAHRI